jgi:serine/threonine protein kinase
MCQAARAVHFAHQNNVLHRDLKPSNFLIDQNHKIWLTDFGLAKRSGPGGLSMPGQAPGTLRYMSSEQCDGCATTVSDVYSLGVTLYEMLALTPAFQDHSGCRLPEQIRAGDCVPLQHHDARIPRDLVVITQKAMATQPVDRYDSAEALADDLQRFLDGRPILARPMSAPEQLFRLMVRHKLFSVLTVLLTVMLVATGTIAVYNEILRRRGLENEIGRLISEAAEHAESRLPGQTTTAFRKIEEAIQRADETPNPAKFRSMIRDQVATILGTPELLPSEQPPRFASLAPFVISSNKPRILVTIENSTQTRAMDGSDDPNVSLNVRDADTGLLRSEIVNQTVPLDFEISPDGSRLLVSSLNDQTSAPELVCWDLTLSQPEVLWATPELKATAITILPGRQQLVAAHDDGSIHRIDLATGRLLQKYPCVGPYTDLQLRPHPHHPVLAVASKSYHEVCFLNLDSGKIIGRLDRRSVSGFDWHPNGQLLALHDELIEIELLHWPSLQSFKTIRNGLGLTHCRFSPNGNWLVINTWSSVSRQSQLIAVRIEDHYALSCPWPYFVNGESHCMSHSGSTVAEFWFEDRLIRADLNDPTCFQNFNLQDTGIIATPSIAAAENLPLVAVNVCGIPGEVLNLQTGTTLQADLRDRRHSILLHNSQLAWSHTGIRSLDQTGRTLWQVQTELADDGGLHLSTYSRIKLPLLQTYKKLSSDGLKCFSTGPSGRILFWPTANPLAIQCLAAELSEPTEVSHSGRLLFCKCSTPSVGSETCVVYDCHAKQVLTTFPVGSGARFSPDERYLLVSGPLAHAAASPSSVSGPSQTLYSFTDRRIIHTLQPGDAVANFSNSGQLLAIRYLNEQFVRLLDTTTGETLLRLPVAADNRGMPFFADDDRQLFIQSIGNADSLVYSIHLESLLSQYASLGLPVNITAPPKPVADVSLTRRRARAESASTLTFSSRTRPLHLRAADALLHSLCNLTTTTPASTDPLAALLTGVCCDALELGCLDAATLTTNWLQQYGPSSSAVAAIQASLLLRQNQPSQALQLLEAQHESADCSFTRRLNRCLALSLLERSAEAMSEIDDLLKSGPVATAEFALQFLRQDKISSKLSRHLATTPELLTGAQDVRSHQLALSAARDATLSWPENADCWLLRALAEICNGLPAESMTSLGKARQLKQNRDDATLQLIEAAIHLHNEDFCAWFCSLLKTHQLFDRKTIGLKHLYYVGSDLPLAITLQVPVRANSIRGRLYRWLLLAESLSLGRTHVDVILKTRTGI